MTFVSRNWHLLPGKVLFGCTQLQAINRTNIPNVLNSFENIEILPSRLNVLHQEFEAHSDSLQDDDFNTNQECNIRSGFECRTERRGWPRFEISQSQLEAVNRVFSALTNDQLDNIVWGVLQCIPSAGLRLVQGSLRRQGLVVQRSRVLCSLRRVDPVTSSLWNSHEIIRRRYNVKSPNSLWQELHFQFCFYSVYIETSVDKLTYN